MTVIQLIDALRACDPNETVMVRGEDREPWVCDNVWIVDGVPHINIDPITKDEEMIGGVVKP